MSRRYLRWPVILVSCAVLLSCRTKQEDELVISGRVEVDNIHVGSKIGGRIDRVNYEEGDKVPAHAAVVTLEDQELVAQLAQAQATTSQSQAELSLLMAGTRPEEILEQEAAVNARKAELQLRQKGFRDEEIRQAEAELASAASALDLAQREYDRTALLLKSRTIDQSQYDRARSDLANARAKVDAAKQHEMLVKSGSRPEEIAMAQAQLSQAEAMLQRLRNGPRVEEISAQHAAVQAAEANIERLKAQLDETRIRAPVEAVVETLDLKPGDLVRAGETIAILNMTNGPWVRCYIPENRLAAAKVGMPVSVTIDSLPGQSLKGRIRRIASDAEFTPRNVQTTEKRSELVFEMKVDILEGREDLRAGMYADVHIPSGPTARK